MPLDLLLANELNPLVNGQNHVFPVDRWLFTGPGGEHPTPPVVNVLHPPAGLARKPLVGGLLYPTDGVTVVANQPHARHGVVGNETQDVAQKAVLWINPPHAVVKEDAPVNEITYRRRPACKFLFPQGILEEAAFPAELFDGFNHLLARLPLEVHGFAPFQGKGAEQLIAVEAEDLSELGGEEVRVSRALRVLDLPEVGTDNPRGFAQSEDFPVSVEDFSALGIDDLSRLVNPLAPRNVVVVLKDLNTEEAHDNAGEAHKECHQNQSGTNPVACTQHRGALVIQGPCVAQASRLRIFGPARVRLGAAVEEMQAGTPALPARASGALKKFQK